jgi:cyclopropane-fatty-acyl-phospholipid synthase
VVSCYSAVDRFFPACGLLDLTEGIYRGDPATSYAQAQANQHEYLLQQAKCGPGHRVLDIGCGYGTLLERIDKRPASGVGITLSPEQRKHCRRGNLEVHLHDYRALPAPWDRTFDAVIANGSIEHFVHPRDVAAGRADEVYRHLFATVHRLIDAKSTSRRLVTTTIHFAGEAPNPLDQLKSPFCFRWGSDRFHWAVLQRGWGGWYPVLGQLERCAHGYFDLLDQVDGTEDYCWTSEHWLRRVRRSLRSGRVVKITLRSVPILLQAPRQFLTLMLYLLATESWNWQFRPPDPPTRLLRQTWEYRDRR